MAQHLTGASLISTLTEDKLACNRSWDAIPGGRRPRLGANALGEAPSTVGAAAVGRSGAPSRAATNVHVGRDDGRLHCIRLPETDFRLPSSPSDCRLEHPLALRSGARASPCFLSSSISSSCWSLSCSRAESVIILMSRCLPEQPAPLQLSPRSARVLWTAGRICGHGGLSLGSHRGCIRGFIRSRARRWASRLVLMRGRTPHPR